MLYRKRKSGVISRWDGLPTAAREPGRPGGTSRGTSPRRVVRCRVTGTRRARGGSAVHRDESTWPQPWDTARLAGEWDDPGRPDAEDWIDAFSHVVCGRRCT